MSNNLAGQGAVARACDRLFRIKVLHGGPKRSHEATETYLIAENEEQVYEWIDENPNFGIWKMREEDGATRTIDDPNHPDVFERAPWKEWVLMNKGDLEDEDAWDDAYYGVTLFGWEEVACPKHADPDLFHAHLIEAGIAKEAKPLTVEASR